MNNVIKNIIAVANIIRLWPHVLLYMFYKKRIIDDVHAIDLHDGNDILKFIRLLCFYKPFRNVFYHRIGKYRMAISWLAPEYETLIIGTHTPIGNGLNPAHAYATIINAEKIGRNFTIFQNVTVGASGGGGKPTIGDNVTIYSNSVVVGRIYLGNNVTIGAGSVVTKNVPDNCVVIGNPARIIVQDGMKTNMKL